MSTTRTALARNIALTAGALLAAAGCSGTSTSQQGVTPATLGARSAGTTTSGSLLNQLKNQVVIGSTIDPVNGASNPYGLTIAPVTDGKFTAGDLVVCNFNGKNGKQGTGKSLIALHPMPGSMPKHISSDKTLLGCDALALDARGPWAAAMVANDNPVLDNKGKLAVNIAGRPFNQPWGQIYAQPPSGAPAFYATNAGNGNVVRINLGAKFTYDVIGKNFPVNHGVPGTALAPSGLAYDPSNDTLYFADGKNNTVVAFKNASTIPNGGIKAEKNGMAFSGPSASNARVVYSGAPLNGPISTALLPDGNLVVGNTLDPDGTNLMIEISPSGQVLGTRNLDTGAAGALFGIVATGTSDADTMIYFNDDNDNNVQVLEH
ncbi:MAG TPA: hypothetical protein VGF18_02915 [Candidatus Tumulicola sp.]